jgi:ribonuclease HI
LLDSYGFRTSNYIYKIMHIIISDGGNKEGTYGSYQIFDPTGNSVLHAAKYWGVGDHNQAEYWILLSALDKALTMGLKSVIIFTDSETVVEQVLLNRPAHAERFKRMRDQVLERLKRFDEWEIQHISRVTVKSFLGH